MQSNKTQKTSNNKDGTEKILRSVPFEQGFHFATDEGKFTLETAINLFSFYEELKTIDLQSVKFHFQRRDFQKWVETTLGDQELALRIDKTPSGLSDEELRKELLKTVQTRFAELQTIFNKLSKNVSVSGQELKKFTLEELKQYNGSGGKPVYFAFEGKVYDSSNSSFWQTGNHMGAHNAGKDLTEEIKSAPHGNEVFGKVKQVGVLG
jgi:predicted heme/steroid binding protein